MTTWAVHLRCTYVSKAFKFHVNIVIWKVTLSFTPYSLCFHPPIPFFEWYLQSKEISLNLSMKCWNSAFNEQQGSRVIIVVVQVGAVTIYVAAVKALREK